MGVKEQPKEPIPKRDPIDANQALSQVTFVQTRNGVKELEINAKEAQLFEGNQTARFKKLLVTTSGKSGAMTISGDLGLLDMDGKKFTIEKETSPVSVSLGNGYLVKTDSLKWSSAEKLIETDAQVTVVGPNIAISGEGLRVFTERSEWMILKNVQAEIN